MDRWILPYICARTTNYEMLAINRSATLSDVAKRVARSPTAYLYCCTSNATSIYTFVPVNWSNFLLVKRRIWPKRVGKALTASLMQVAHCLFNAGVSSYYYYYYYSGSMRKRSINAAFHVSKLNVVVVVCGNAALKDTCSSSSMRKRLFNAA